MPACEVPSAEPRRRLRRTGPRRLRPAGCAGSPGGWCCSRPPSGPVSSWPPCCRGRPPPTGCAVGPVTSLIGGSAVWSSRSRGSRSPSAPARTVNEPRLPTTAATTGPVPRWWCPPVGWPPPTRIHPRRSLDGRRVRRGSAHPSHPARRSAKGSDRPPWPARPSVSTCRDRPRLHRGSRPPPPPIRRRCVRRPVRPLSAWSPLPCRTSSTSWAPCRSGPSSWGSSGSPMPFYHPLSAP